MSVFRRIGFNFERLKLPENKLHLEENRFRYTQMTFDVGPDLTPLKFDDPDSNGNLVHFGF